MNINNTPNFKPNLPDESQPTEKTGQTGRSTQQDAMVQRFSTFKPGDNSLSKPVSGNFTSLQNKPAEKNHSFALPSEDKVGNTISIPQTKQSSDKQTHQKILDGACELGFWLL